MITSIHLHPIQQARLNEVDLEQLEKDVLSRFPYPIAVSYRNFLKAASGGDGMNILTTFAYDVTTSIFQFLALVLASDYHENRSARSLKIYNAIADMSYLPSPGKWLEFLKMYPNHLKESNERSFAFGEIISFIEMNVGGKKKPRLTIEENYGNAHGKQAGLLEFMVMFRNNLAHSKGQKEKDITDQAASVVAVTNYLFSELSFLMQYRLVIKTEDITNPFYMMGDSLDALPELDIDENIFLQKESHGLKLFPLIISDRPAKSRPEDVFLLESVDNDRVFFSGNRIMSEKLKGRDDMANKVFDFLQNIYTEPEILDLARTSWEQFRNRCKDYSQQVLSDYVINNKYNEAVYVLPESYQETISGFRKSGKQVVFLTDGQGVGKSALCAHLTNEFIIHGNTNEASLLIDARLLEELQEEQDIFLEFIKKKLGLQGELPDFFRKLQDLEDNPKITLIIDNMNEYFLKERDQSFLLEQLFDTVNRFAGLNNIQIIVIARPEYYVKSFGKYCQSFQDFVAQTTYMPGKTAATPLPGLEENETEKIWNNYQQKFTGYSPRTNWSDLNLSVRKSCNNPLIMLFLLKRYDNEELPQNLSIEKIKKQYIRGILKKKELKKTLFDLVKKMHKEQRPYLLTESFTREEIARLFDTTKDKKTNLPRNHAYAGLVDMQILREERVENDGKSGKKISVNNEMTLDVVTSEYQINGIKQKLRLAGIINIAILIIILLSVIIITQKAGMNNPSNELNLEIETHLDLNNKDIVYSVMSNFLQNDYPRKVLNIFRVSYILSLGFCMLLILFLYDLLDVILFLYSVKKGRNKTNFHTYLSNVLAGRQFYKKIAPLLIFLFFAFIAIGLLIITFSKSIITFLEYNNISLDSIVVYFLICFISLIFLLFANKLYDFVLNDRTVVVSEIRNSFKNDIKSLTLNIIWVAFLATIILLSFNKLTNTQYAYWETFYLQKAEIGINELRISNDYDQLKELAASLHSKYSHEPAEHSLFIFSILLSKSLDDESLQLIPVESSLHQTLLELKSLGKYSFSEIWIYLLFIPLLLIMLILAVEVPLKLAQRKLQDAPDLRII